MNTNKFYVSPIVEYLNVENEGVLCQSKDTDSIEINDWKQGNGSIDF